MSPAGAGFLKLVPVLFAALVLSGCEGYLEGVAERNCNPTVDGYDECVHDRATLQDRGLWPTPGIGQGR